MSSMLKRTLGLILLFLVTATAKAGIDVPVLRVLDGTAGQVKKDSVVMVEDIKFFDVGNTSLIRPYLVRNMVSFEINEDALIMLQSNFKVTARLQITSTINASGTTVVTEKDFTIRYDKDGSYPSRATYLFENAYRVEVKILSLDSAGATWNVSSVLKVVNQLQSFPRYSFDCNTNAVKSITHDPAFTAGSTADELRVWWLPEVSADEYDLEWTYVDADALADSLYGNPNAPDINKIFENNASRVTISATEYKIPLFYDGKGKLFFRVRTVQWNDVMGPEQGRKEATWSSNWSGGTGALDYNGHEQQLNWQSSISFAEDGKRKGVMQYFDGSLRSRQTVTKDNVSNKTIVTESMYDYQGRPVIQTLPVPTLSNVISYTRNFNRAIGHNDYDKSLFDTLTSATDYCGQTAIPMDVTSGASRYYSPSNDSAGSTNPIYKYIPDAEGYPFTEVVYLQDGSGRVSRQSGVGKDFKIGSGHETKFYYGTPTQNELNALFGTEVGDKTHYFKNMVRDANGQLSVSYVDMRGRTIATALAGDILPVKLDSLASRNSRWVTDKLSDSASAIRQGLVMTSKMSLPVNKEGLHQFKYELSPQILRMEGCDTTKLCYDCLYDLTITITDDCNNETFGGQPFVHTVKNFSLSNIDTSCNTSTGFNTSFSQVLRPGVYQITKKLSLSQYAMDYYRDSVFMKKNHCKSIEDFIKEQRQIFQQSTQECAPSCSGCLDSLGTWEQFWAKYRTQTGIADADTSNYREAAQTAYANELQDCNELCATRDEYSEMRNTLLSDLTPPAGQYASYDTATTYNIFGRDAEAPYRKVSGFKNGTGKLDSVFIAPGHLIPPQQLTTTAFRDNFKESWAETLLPLHPEYCKLQKLEMLKTSYEWDKRFEETEGYAVAKQKGYLNPTNNSASPFRYFNGSGTLDSDPLATLLNSRFKPGMENMLTNYKTAINNGTFSMWGVAAASAVCGNLDEACMAKYRFGPALDTAVAICDADRDMAWKMFRTMYLQAKKKLINDYLNTECSAIPAGALISLGYQPRFASPEQMLGQAGITIPGSLEEGLQEKANAEQKLLVFYQSTCSSYVKNWLAQLSTCKLYSPTELNNVIIPQLIEVCKEGSDISHPMGSSSVKPSSTYRFKSFEEVIDNYNRINNITAPECNAYAIVSPMPYDKQPAYNMKPLISKPDSCECELVNKAYYKYRNVKHNYTSFSDYMSKAYQVAISDTVLSKFLGLCDGTYTCNFLQEQLFLPAPFQCNTGEVCIDCNLFRQADSTFRAKYPTYYPNGDLSTKDSTQKSWNNLYANFLNYKLGFTKTATEYLDFAYSCDGKWRTPGCDSLNRLLSDFKEDYRKKYAVSYVIKTQEGVILSNPVDIIRNGATLYPDSIRQRPGISWNNFEVKPNMNRHFCADNGFTVEIRFKFLKDLLTGHQFQLIAGGSSVLFERYPTWISRPDGSYKKGILLSTISGFSDTTKFGYGTGNAYDFITADTNENVILDWCVVKYKVTASKYYVYFNGRLLVELPRNPALTLWYFQNIQLNMRSRQGSVDWVKLFDGNGELKYFEDFVNLTSPNVPKAPGYCPTSIPDCQVAFRDSFNTKFGTNYSIGQIEQLYYTKCGRALDVCGTADSLKATLARFNQVKPNKPLVSLHTSGLSEPDSVITDASRIFRDGSLAWPGYIQEKRAPIFTHAKIRNPGLEYCTASGFGAETRMKLVSSPASGNSDIFTFSNANVKYVINLQVTGLYLKEVWMYNNSNVWVNALSTPVMLNQVLNGNLQEWHEYKITVKSDSIRFIYDGVVKSVLPNLKGSMINSDEFDYSFLSHNGVLDWVKINDHTGDRVYMEDFSDPVKRAEFKKSFICSTIPNCQSEFVNYFNQQRNTSLNFQKIDSLYFVHTGRSLDVCGTKDSLQSIVDRYNAASGLYKLRTIQFTNSDYYKTTPYYYHEIPEYAIGDGMFRWPDTLRDSNEGRGWRVFTFMPPQFYFCTEQGYTIEAKVHALRDIWSRGEEVLYVQDANHQIVLYRRDPAINDGTKGFWISRVIGENPQTGAYNQELLLPVNNDIRISNDPYELTNKWSTLKIVVTRKSYKFYWDGVLQCDLARSVNTIKPVSTVSFNFYSFYGAIDWVRMLDHRNVEQWNEDFEDRQKRAQINPSFICPKPTAACQVPFTNYYNQQKGTNYTYAKIDSLYYAMNGRYLNICGTNTDPNLNTKLCGRNKEVLTSFDFSADEINNCTDSTYFITSKSTELYRIYQDSLKGKFDSSYRAKCLDAYKYEKFTVRHEVAEYHYTLYYYDQAGNLVKTVPPAGVKPNYDSVWLLNVDAARTAGTELLPLHELPTDYRYNTLNQVVAQKSPDGGMSKFWYDRLGRLTISQNARQRYASATEENRLYSYTKYDILGRITEVGQVKNLTSNGAMLDTITRTPSLLNSWMVALNQRREQITTTVYDLAYEGFVGVLDNRQLVVQRNLRNRVSYTTYTDSWNTANYNQGTFYTYDIHGNVDTLLQDFGCGTCGITAVHNVMNQNGNRFKKISYNFDLISGKVNSVAYQRGWSDQFFHKYSYDGENRLTVVETSLDGYTWEKDARYEYYLHGPLARTILGTQQVQGLDYAYTLQGWLKGINSAGAKDSFDIGGDGKIISPNRYVARDAYGFALNYHGTDYKAIGSSATAFPNYSAHLNSDFRPLFNGNISSMVSTNRIFENPALTPDTSTLFFNYTYDQLNRITGMDVFHNFNRTENKYDGLTKFANGQFKETVAYDPNGNILSYLRNTVGATPAMDNLTYHYYAGTNKLKRVNDLVPANKVGSNPGDKIIDIDDQEDEENYIYDSIGNLIQDKAEKINSIDWNVYGKIVGISRDGNTHVAASEIKYSYDASGNRISKSVTKNDSAHHTWYVRDAQGNVMATYNSTNSSANNLPAFDLKESERYIYGSSRLGVVNKEQGVDNGNSGPAEVSINQVDSFPRGIRVYELSNHLGNVLVTISDKKKGIADPILSSLISHFEPIMLSGTDYYPFGMAMRVGGDNKYKYGFNGKENDNEAKGGDGLLQDYGFRVYDPRLGKFLSVDPLTKDYPWYTPYQFSGNKPIACIDLDGLEEVWITNNAFAPFDLFGSDLFGSYSGDGDNRKFGDGGTYRSSGTARLHLTTGEKAVFRTGTSISTYHRKIGSDYVHESPSKMEQFYHYSNFENTYQHLEMHIAGSNGAVFGNLAPTIDAHVNIYFEKNSQDPLKFEVAGTITGDNFPANETILEDKVKGKIILGVSGPNAGKVAGPYIMLFGDLRREMYKFRMTILFNENETFKGVEVDGKEYTVEEWNKLFSELDPKSSKVHTTRNNESGTTEIKKD